MGHNPIIVLAGGGTGGSVTALIALRDILGASSCRWRWIGTTFGVERHFAISHDIAFYHILAGKWRRYPSVRTLLTPLAVAGGFLQSFLLLACWRPALVISSGSFIAVPVVWAATLLGIPRIVIQQDRHIGLANTLMLPVATLALSTVRIPISTDRRWKRFIYCGTLIRTDLTHHLTTAFMEGPDLPSDQPVLLLIAGATGSMFFNDLAQFLDQLLTPNVHIVHIQSFRWASYQGSARYHPLPLAMQELAHYYQRSTLVVSRAGMGVMAECAAFHKPVIVVPLPTTHQEDNARWLAQEHAVVVIEQGSQAPARMMRTIEKLLERDDYRLKLSKRLAELMPPADAVKVRAMIRAVIPL